MTTLTEMEFVVPGTVSKPKLVARVRRNHNLSLRVSRDLGLTYRVSRGAKLIIRKSKGG